MVERDNFANSPLVEENRNESNGESAQPVDESIFEANWETCVDKFDDMGLREDLLRGIYGHGFKEPSPIQQKAIIPIIQGKDTIAQAQAGTGKTGAFAIGCLQNIDPTNHVTQCLILSNSRELCTQIGSVIQSIGEFSGVKVYVCVGGKSVFGDKKALEEGVHVVVATPGRVTDLMKRGFFKSDYLQQFVLDEADEMLSSGFQVQVKEIFKFLPADIKIALFSATLPHHVLELTTHFMNDPVRILVKKEDLTLEKVNQFYIAIPSPNDKVAVLLNLYENLDIQQALIYCNTKKRVIELAEDMNDKQFTVGQMHADMEQDQRDIVMKQFRSGSTRVLITTDLLARGIDVQQVSLVINYDLPQKKEQYMHRVGRAGRYGRKGNAFNFVTPNDARFIKEVQEFYSTQINELPQDLDDL